MAAVLCLLACAPAAFAAPAAGRKPRSAVDATVGFGILGRAVPQSFIGLSMETSDLPRYEAFPAFPRFLAQVGSADNGAVSLRIGGESSDSSWEQPGLAATGGYTLDAAWFHGLSRLADAVPLRVLFDLNLPVRSPAIAAEETHDVLAALPKADLAGVEVGNEPDLYSLGMLGFLRPGPGLPAWALSYAPADYARDFAAYSAAVHNVAPKLVVAGPATAYAGNSWWAGLPRRGRSRLGLVTVHRYPLSACTSTPTLSGLVSGPNLVSFDTSIHQEAVSAFARGLPLRVTEANSASCGGLAGVNNTFATALWAPNALLGLMSAGADGVDIHTRVDAINTPLQGRPTIAARPLLYGLILLARMLGPGAYLQDTIRHGGAGLSTWAVYLADGTRRLLLVNKSANGFSVGVNASRTGAARTLALRAPSLGATSGVTLGGQTLDAHGRWRGRSTDTNVQPDAGTYRVTVPGYSALLVSIPAH